MKEFVIWGKPRGETEETILYTKAKSLSEAQLVSKIIEKKFGATDLRVQVLDLSTCPDFTKTITIK